MTKRIRSAIPIYLAALVWIIYGMIFPLYLLRHIFAAAGISAAVYLMTSYVFPGRSVTIEKKITTGDAALDSQLNDARALLKQIHESNNRIPDPVITAKLNRMEEVGGKILDRVAEHPADANNIRRFMNYYLPTAEKLFSAYAKLQEAGGSGKAVSGAMKRIEDSLNLIVTAFEKQLDSLYRDEYLDITTDIQVLETMMQSDGLTQEGTPLT